MRERQVEYPITNRYTFAKVFSKPENARPLLEAVLGKPIGEIRTVESEHTIDPSLRGRGVRLDVFVEDGSGAVYDVEMQNVDEGNLALRSRYLLSSFDRDRIIRGQDYLDLGNSIVIFICNFDPIGLGDRMYVIRPALVDRWQVYDDGTTRVFLNARGAASLGLGELGDKPRLASFLSYVDGGDTMGDEWVESIDKEVRALNADEGWRQTVLGLQLDFEHARHLAQKEGHAIGLAEGREAGLAEGRAVGLAEGHEAGLAEGREAGLAEGREAGLAEGREAGLAEGREAGLTEGREVGLVEGREAGLQESDRVNRLLTEALVQEGRVDELAQAMLDPQRKAALLKELGIE